MDLLHFPGHWLAYITRLQSPPSSRFIPQDTNHAYIPLALVSRQNDFFRIASPATLPPTAPSFLLPCFHMLCLFWFMGFTRVPVLGVCTL